MAIKDKIITYFKKKSKLSIASDIIFYLFIIALIIPSSRRIVLEHLHRLIMWSPSAIERNDARKLSIADYNWKIADKDGKIYQLSDFDGKVVFINFWATWCGPCLAELPAMGEMYEHYKNNDKIVFLFVTSENPQEASEFLRRRNLDLPVFRYVQPAPQAISSSTIPATFVIDKQGYIVIEEFRAKKWNSKKSYNLLDKLIESE